MKIYFSTVLPRGGIKVENEAHTEGERLRFSVSGRDAKWAEVSVGREDALGVAIKILQWARSVEE
jgi:hypothetical protein